MPGAGKGAKGPKGQPDAFRSCVACMLSAQSRDANTAKAARALFALAKTPEAMLALDDAALIARDPAGGALQQQGEGDPQILPCADRQRRDGAGNA